jgi:ABC-type tungstate transport system permease subunit
LAAFLTGKPWQLGLVTRAPLEQVEIAGYPVQSVTIEAGKYGSMKTIGHPEMIFVHWEKLRKILLKDGYTVDYPIYEYFTDLFDESIPKKEQRGEIRYLIRD